MPVSPNRLSIPIRLLDRLDWIMSQFVQIRLSTAPKCRSSSCFTMMFAALTHLSRHCWSFLRVPTRLGRTWHIGIVRHWRERHYNNEKAWQADVWRLTSVVVLEKLCIITGSRG